MKRKWMLLIIPIAALTFSSLSSFSRESEQGADSGQVADVKAKIANLELQRHLLDQEIREARRRLARLENPLPGEATERAMQFDRLGRPVPLLRN